MSDSSHNGAPGKPQVLSMMLCDAVWRDPSTGKTFIQGGFTAISAPQFPCAVAKFSAYIAMTQISGAVPINLRLVFVDDATTEPKDISSAQAKVDSHDPLAVAEGEFLFHDVVFDRPGEYRFILECEGNTLLERRLVAIPRGVPQP
jgi:hypothetical protein